MVSMLYSGDYIIWHRTMVIRMLHYKMDHRYLRRRGKRLRRNNDLKDVL